MRFPTEEENRMFEAIKPYLDERCKLKEDAPDEIKELADKFWESFKDASCQMSVLQLAEYSFRI